MTALVLLGCAAFGAVTQYVGSLTRYWALAWQVGALSAPWLLLPFLVGLTRRSRLAAAVCGAAGTWMALVAYGAMTISPLENAAFTTANAFAFVQSNLVWFAGACVTGFAFGLLGRSWRVARSRPAAYVTAATLIAEPFVRTGSYRPIPFGPVSATEAALGLGLVAWFTYQGASSSTKRHERRLEGRSGWLADRDASSQ